MQCYLWESKVAHRWPHTKWYTPQTKNAQYMAKIDANSGYRSWSLNKMVIPIHIYMSMWKVQFFKTRIWSGSGRRYAQAKNQWSIPKDMPNVFDIEDDILIVGYDDRTLRQIMSMFRWEHLKLNTIKCHFRYPKIHSLGKWYPEKDATRPEEVVCANWKVSSNNKKEL